MQHPPSPAGRPRRSPRAARAPRRVRLRTHLPDGGDAGSATAPSRAADGDKTIAFSPLALRIPAMKGLRGRHALRRRARATRSSSRTPTSTRRSRSPTCQRRSSPAAWRCLGDLRSRRPRMTALVQTAQDEGAADPQRHAGGLRPRRPEPGIRSPPSTTSPRARRSARSSATASTRSSAARPRSCRGERPRHRRQGGARDRAKEALAATAPDAEIVQTMIVKDRAKAQTDVGSALQGNPDVTAVIGQQRRGRARRPGAFAAAGKELTCLTEAGGNDEVLRRSRTARSTPRSALQFQADMAQSFDALVAMIDDPKADGVQSDRAPEGRQGGGLTRRARTTEAEVEARAAPARPRSPPARRPPHVSVLVFLRDRGIFVLWGC